ncbi:relaxase domain-containing protein [Streptomyces sp. NPDC088555]|uniref:relaxase domain-containing protein n=1 Tax=Streptomyces sp. NPDC088555 TaxID=3365866 RepID=UPI00381FBF9C
MALGDARTRRIIERAHERATAKALRWLEDEVAETRWSSGRERAKTPALVVAAFRHFDNRDNFPLLHDHRLILNRVQRLDDGEPVWGALDTRRRYRHVVAAGTLYTLAMTTEVCEELGLATVPRDVTPGLTPHHPAAVVDDHHGRLAPRLRERAGAPEHHRQVQGQRVDRAAGSPRHHRIGLLTTTGQESVMWSEPCSSGVSS